ERRGESRKAGNAAGETAGVAGRIPYDLRRTAVRNMIRAGVDQAVAMKISGHRTDAIFRRYNIVSDDDLREAVVKTAAYVASLPAERKVLPLAEGTAGKNFP
ncbi:MAG: tyrosine-type recombinase/integrase, partial [Chloroflexota bacterium]